MVYKPRPSSSSALTIVPQFSTRVQHSTSTTMIKVLIALALVACVMASEKKVDSYAEPKQQPALDRNAVYSVLAKKQLAVNKAAEYFGAGTGTAYYEGVPGVNGPYGYDNKVYAGYGPPGYGKVGGYGGKAGYDKPGYANPGYAGYGNQGYGKEAGYAPGYQRGYAGEYAYEKPGAYAAPGNKYHEGAFYNYGPHNDHFYGQRAY